MLHGLWLSWHSLLRVLVVAVAWVLAAPTMLRPLRLLVLLRLLELRLMLRLSLGWLLMLLRLLELRLMLLRLSLGRLLMLLGLLGLLLGLLMLLSLRRLPLPRLPRLGSVPSVILIVVVGQSLAGPKQQDKTNEPARNRAIPSNLKVRVHESLLVYQRGWTSGRKSRS
jgi:hypothetical protein